MGNEELHQSAAFRHAKSGDRKAFDEIFSAHATPLRLFVRYRMGKQLRSAMESMDFVQEVYVQAYQGFEGFLGRSNGEFYRWLCGIATHRMMDQRRRIGAIKRGGKMRMEIASPSETSPVDRAAAAKPGPLTLAALREDGARMEDSFAQLPERDQEVIGLRQFEGLSSKDTGKKMGLAEGAVNVLYFRAMGRWRELLEKDGG